MTETLTIQQEWAARADELADWTASKLVMRTDCWGHYTTQGASFTAPAVDLRRDGVLTRELLVQHFRGEITIGLHTTAPGNTCRSVTFDVDAHDDKPETAEQNWQTVLVLFSKLAAMGLDPLVTDSDGKGGYHVKIILKKPIASSFAFRFGKMLAADLPGKVEVFPKQAEIDADGYGNFIRLYGKHHKRDHWTRVWDGSEWIEGTAAIDTILMYDGDDPAIIVRHVRSAEEQERKANHASNGKHHHDGTDAVKRCIAYLEKCPDSIEGEHGHDKLFRAACECLRFGLTSDGDILDVLTWFNARKCSPPWSERELAHKIASARRKVTGSDIGSRLRDDRQRSNGSAPRPEKTRDESQPLILDPKDPAPIARLLVQRKFYHAGSRTIHFDGGEFNAWAPRAGKYQIEPMAAVRSEAYRFLEPAQKYVKRGEAEMLEDFKPNKSAVDNVINALKAEAFQRVTAPCWLSDAPDLPPVRDLIPARNGIWRMTTTGLELVGQPTPQLYSFTALDYDVDPNAPRPVKWLEFLQSAWSDDPQQINTLQEAMGYYVVPDTSLQKILMLVGPRRSGKGTIGRILTAMVGPENVCGPTLSGMCGNFGLWGLLGKSLAIISDARLSGRSDQAIVTERLLAISGEDAVEVHRKNLASVTLRLPVRFLILTNELPKLSDASGALPSRLIVLRMTRSFLGNEDHALTEKLMPELPGILLWALDGLRRLRARGRFVQPDTSAEAIEQMEELASPVKAFVTDWCQIAPGEQTPIDLMYSAWCAWCANSGTMKPATVHVFGRDLSAAFPAIGIGRPRTDAGRVRVYRGIRLTESAAMTAQAWKAKHGGPDER
jgi:putative DNA primase/helicase